ncbi:hypothetical protein LTR53_009308 [Teratosphaeriaceae sp. CCFEE 6253]|nr:hypothetical protein LTR53_009308 [Teratosphaeriaceae sp. CCFEE 6253]
MYTFEDSEVLELSHKEAETHAVNGLCGDVAHLDDCQITECSVAKWMVIVRASGAYYIVHAEHVAPWDAAGPTRAGPLMLPATAFSAGCVRYLESIESEVQAQVKRCIKGNGTHADGAMMSSMPQQHVLQYADSMQAQQTDFENAGNAHHGHGGAGDVEAGLVAVRAADSAKPAAKATAGDATITTLTVAEPISAPACVGSAAVTACGDAQSSSERVSKDEQAAADPVLLEADWSDVDLSEEDEFEIIGTDTL